MRYAPVRSKINVKVRIATIIAQMQILLHTPKWKTYKLKKLVCFWIEMDKCFFTSYLYVKVDYYMVMHILFLFFQIRIAWLVGVWENGHVIERIVWEISWGKSVGWGKMHFDHQSFLTFVDGNSSYSSHENIVVGDRVGPLSSSFFLKLPVKSIPQTRK